MDAKKDKKHKYERLKVPLSYGAEEPPDIYCIVELIANKELTAWKFVKAMKFTRDERTGFSRPRVIKFRRPLQEQLQTTICDYMPVTVADDQSPPDKDGGWEKVGVIERDAWKRPRMILFRRIKRI